jgi:hypothetical protein
MKNPARNPMVALLVIAYLILFSFTIFMIYTIHRSYEPVQPVAGAFNPTGGGTYQLQSSISSTQNTVLLTSFTEPGSNIPYTMTYLNSDIEYGTISPSSGNSEFISFTGITQNANGTANLTGVVRGLARSPGNTGCVASTTLAHGYPGQTNLAITNTPCFYAEYATKRNDQVITGQFRFDQYPTASSTIGFATTSLQFITLAQAQALTVQGAATSTESIAGIVRLATALQVASSTDLGATIPLVMQSKNATDTPVRGCATGYTATAGAGCAVIASLAGKISQTFLDIFSTANVFSLLQTFTAGFTSNGPATFNATSTAATSTQPTGFKGVFSLVAGMAITASTPQAVTLATSSGRVYLVDGNVSTTTDFYGFALSSAAAAGPIQVQTTGIVTGFSGLTAGSRYYVQDTSSGGAIGTTVGTSEVYVGIAISATELALDSGGSAGSWQYLGSQNLSCPSAAAVNQPLARFAVLSMYGTQSTPQSSGSDLFISKVGKTSTTFSDGVVSSPDIIISASWSGSTITTTLTEGTTCSVTAYYYR